MTLLTFVAQFSGNSRLLQQPVPNFFFYNVSLLIGFGLLVAWIIYSPKLKVRRFSMWFWIGLAASAVIGPFVGALWK